MQDQTQTRVDESRSANSPTGSTAGSNEVAPAAHSPLPWHAGPHYRSDVESREGRIAECGMLRGPRGVNDAAFIVRACNNHYDLLAALKSVVAMYGPSTEYSHEAQKVWERAEAAIAKAEGR